MGDVIPLFGEKGPDADTVLEAAKGKLGSAVVIGWDKDGFEYFASSLADGAEVLWLLERMKLQMLLGAQEAPE